MAEFRGSAQQIGDADLVIVDGRVVKDRFGDAERFQALPEWIKRIGTILITKRQ